MSKEVKVMTSIGVLIVAAAAIIFATSGGENPAPSGAPVGNQNLLRSDSHYIGSKLQNTVTLVEFGDFECPACGAAHPIIQQVLDHYKDHAGFTFVFRNFPLTSIHINAQIAAEAAEAAADQGKFWEMYDKLYENQNDWVNLSDPTSVFAQYASNLGIDVNKFATAVKDSQFLARVNEDINDGHALNINSTPTFYLNGVQMVGVPAYDDLVSKIDADFKSASAAQPSSGTASSGTSVNVSGTPVQKSTGSSSTSNQK